MSCVLLYYVKCEQNLLTNSIRTYTITTLRVNQWEIFVKEFTSDINSGWKDVDHIQYDLLCVHFAFLQILLAGRLIQLISSC